MSDPFDFKAQARSLLKQLGQNPGAPLNQGLALAAVEAALREAFAQGQGTAPVATKRPTLAARAPVRGAPLAPIAPRECAHEWEVVSADESEGEPVSKCMECGVLQSDVQARCEHYFVNVGNGEVCMACRKRKRRA